MANLELTLRDIARTGSGGAAIVGTALLAVALCAELMRRHRSDSVLVRVADRLVPATVHRIAVGILTLLATATSVAMPSVASADTSLRGWLESPSVPTTVVAPATASASAQPLAPPAAQPPPADQPPPAPVATPSPSPAPVLHLRLPATPPTSAPAPARTPSTTTMRPTAPAVPAPSPPAAAAADPPAAGERSVQYVVVAGDCLWDIAARLIGPSASNAAIDRGWRAIYAANRAAIGDDPGLIHPGLVLTLPTLNTTP